MPVKVPDFASIVRAAPLPRQTPIGAIAGPIIGNSLAGFSNSITENKTAKQSILSFADIMEAKSPETAAMYRTMAEGIPLFDPESLSGGSGVGRARGAGGVGGGPSMGGIQGQVMKDMMDQIATERDVNAFQQKQAIGYQFDAAMAGLRHQNEISEILQRGEIQGQLQDAREQFTGQIEDLHEKQKVRSLTAAESLQLQRLTSASENLDTRLAATKAENEKKNKIDQQNANTSSLNSMTRMLGLGKDAKTQRSPTRADINAAIRGNPPLWNQWQAVNKELQNPLLDPDSRKAKEQALKAIDMDATRLIGSPSPVVGPTTATDALGGLLKTFKQ